MEQENKKIIQFKNIVKKFDNQIILKGIDLDIYQKRVCDALRSERLWKNDAAADIRRLSRTG